MKLEPKHLMPYLLFNLKILDIKGNRKYELIPYKRPYERLDKKILLSEVFGYEHEAYKPILRPLSDLTKDEGFYEQFYNAFKDDDEHLDYVCEFKGDLTQTVTSWRCISFLVSAHFDVFGLIEKGLAININTLKQ